MRGESGEETSWSLEHLDASQIHARRLNAKEVVMPKKW